MVALPGAARGWAADRPGRRAAGLARAGVGNDLAVADRLVGDGQLEDSVEDQAAAARAATVEAEHKLVEIGGQVRLIDRALVGAKQPALASEETLCTPGSSLEASWPDAPFSGS